MASHCAEVARGVADLGADADAVAAALLHSALSRGVIASPDALAAALPPGPSRAAVTALVRAVARMSDLCAVRRWSAAAVAAVEEEGMALAAEATTATPTTTLDAGALVDVLLAMADPRAAVIKLVDRVVQLRAAVAAGGAAAVSAADDALAVSGVAALADPRPLYVVSDNHPVLRRDWYARLAAAAGGPPPTFAPRPDGGTSPPRRGQAADKRVDASLVWRDLGITPDHPDPLAELASLVKA
jgi:hypothetical protein